MSRRLVIGPSSLVDSFPVPCNFLLAPLLQSFPLTPISPPIVLSHLAFNVLYMWVLGGGIFLDPTFCYCFGGGSVGGGGFILTNISPLVKCGKKC